MARVASLHPAILYTQGTLTILVNVILCLVFLVSKKLHTTSNTLLISNSLADCLIGVYLICVPIFPNQIQQSDANPCRPVHHEICLLLSCVGAHLNAVSIAHWAAIAVERLLRIFYTELHKRARNLLIGSVLLCWLLPVFPTYGRRFLPLILQLYPYDSVTNGSFGDRCHNLTGTGCQCQFCVHRSFSIVALSCQYFLPMALATGSYCYIILKICVRLREVDRLRIQVLGASATANESGCFANLTHRTKRFFKSRDFRSIRLFLLILLVFMAFVGQYLVERVEIIIKQEQQVGVREGYFVSGMRVQRSADRGPNLTQITGYLNPLVNPILIFAISRRFRSGFVALVTRCRVVVNGKRYQRAVDTSSQFIDSRWNELARHFVRGS
ncbi:hypothetical protein BV898_13296 [Hypsibius exemplaris]|uniref:G-protein coupled receptors family 1 profile domain-containing protein n=1 Tax=Hypsibius exemplaris TaxID=2072580 RepID=A0A1W0WB70_HYPEX|nr:hypothetical protein BV898_13296 [Hypsibius exemplaris]